MTDRISPERRSWNMSQVRSRDTKPEKLVRRLLHGMGFRFSLRRKDLPGKPDIVLPKHKLVIFVHGCFWHHHARCRKSALPASNRFFWQTKILANVERDRRVRHQLRRAGWKSLVFWECQTQRPGFAEKLRERMKDHRLPAEGV